MKLGLSITSRGVLKFQRIDRIKAPFVYEEGYFPPIITDDVEWAAAFWFNREQPICDSDGSVHYPIKLRMFSEVLNVEHVFTKEQVLEAYRDHWLNGRHVLHSLLKYIDPKWYE